MNIKIILPILSCLFLINLSGYASAEDSLKIIQKKNKEFLKKSPYVLIPAGTVSTGNFYGNDGQLITPEVPYFSHVEIKSFIMAKGEVTNIDYLEFLAYYKTRDPEKFKKIMPDTLVWRTPLAFNEPYVEYYFRHPAYQNYPVVGISYQQAKLYCAWLTELYNQNPDRIFKQVIYRLPTEAEWVYAAKGGNDDAVYPWNGQYMRASNGDIKANCLTFGPEGVFRDTLYEKDKSGEYKAVYIYRTYPNRMGVASNLNDGADVTAPAISYWPNAFGLYNMAGNVSEMVEELGLTHGGSWRDPGAYLQNHVRQFYEGENSASAQRGFRYVIEVVEY